MPTSTARKWCVTLNNYQDSDIHTIETVLTEICQYIIVSKEIGASETPHLQGYFETSTRKSLKALKKILPTAHLEIARGTAEDNIKYCSKQNEPFYTMGTPMKQGKRSDLDDVVEMIQAGDTLQQLWQKKSKTMILHHKGISIAFKKLSPHLKKEVFTHPIESFSFQIVMDWSKTQILWGASGVGKTSYAVATLPKALIVSHMDDLLNFDEQIHEGIIFDDMSFNHLPRTSQIHLVDQDFQRSIHCRYMTATIPAHTKKILTTNDNSGNCVDITDPAIKRRIQIHEIKP